MADNRREHTFIRSVFIISRLLALCLPATSALASDEIREPLWTYDEQSETWCFVIDPRRACLPGSFWHAMWIDDDQEYTSLFIEYDDESPMGPGDDGLPGEEFQVLSTAQTGGVTITELASDESRQHAHATSVFVVEFEEGFSLTLFGVDRDTETLRRTAASIVEEWLAPRS